MRVCVFYSSNQPIGPQPYPEFTYAMKPVRRHDVISWTGNIRGTSTKKLQRQQHSRKNRAITTKRKRRKMKQCDKSILMPERIGRVERHTTRRRALAINRSIEALVYDAPQIATINTLPLRPQVHNHLQQHCISSVFSGFPIGTVDDAPGVLGSVQSQCAL